MPVFRVTLSEGRKRSFDEEADADVGFGFIGAASIVALVVEYVVSNDTIGGYVAKTEKQRHVFLTCH